MNKMHRRRATAHLFGVLACLAAMLCAGSPLAQATSLKDPLVGAWALVSFDSFDPTGKQIPSIEGNDLKGRLIFTPDGQFSIQMIAELPKLASQDRLKTTAAEDKTIAHGVLSFFGTYTVDEVDKIITLHVERSSFPNQIRGKGLKRLVTLSGDDLKLTNPGRSAGGQNTIVWKRIR